MRKLLAVGLLLALPCAAGAFFFSPGGNNGVATTSLSWDNITVTDNAIVPEKLKSSNAPDNTMYPRYKSAAEFEWTTPAGTGDVVGPASANDGYFALWDNTTGKLLKDGFSSVNPAFSTANIYGANALNLGTGSSIAGSARFKNATNNFYFQILGGVAGADIGWILPTAAPGGANYLLNVDVDGTMGYTDPAAFLAPDGDGSSLTGITSGQVSGLGTMASQAADNVNITDGLVDATIGSRTPKPGTFTTITFDTATSTCVPADNNCGQTANDTGDPTGADLSAGLQWFNTTTNQFKIRNGDNTATLTLLDKSVKFTKEWGCDNVVLALDNNSIVFPAGFAQAATIDNIMARVSTDNVGFQLKHCAPDNVSDCTYINDELLATNAAGMTSTATFTDATIPAGRPVLIEFTTAGTSNSNRFYMGVRYSVD